ncbi:MAG: serine hydrolase [Candidatus Heimdallarchaeota archaeon]
MDYLPDRVYPPGEITSYSNYGLTLAGYIVEVISRVPFEEYIENEILIPMGMNIQLLDNRYLQVLLMICQKVMMRTELKDLLNTSMSYQQVCVALL